ncbi:hypothetical protein BDK51DRAFT_49622, partial [Blyttiomyces helicus]
MGRTGFTAHAVSPSWRGVPELWKARFVEAPASNNAAAERPEQLWRQKRANARAPNFGRDGNVRAEGFARRRFAVPGRVEVPLAPCPDGRSAKCPVVSLASTTASTGLPLEALQAAHAAPPCAPSIRPSQLSSAAVSTSRTCPSLKDTTTHPLEWKAQVTARSLARPTTRLPHTPPPTTTVTVTDTTADISSAIIPAPAAAPHTGPLPLPFPRAQSWPAGPASREPYEADRGGLKIWLDGGLDEGDRPTIDIQQPWMSRIEIDPSPDVSAYLFNFNPTSAPVSDASKWDVVTLPLKTIDVDIVSGDFKFVRYDLYEGSQVSFNWTFPHYATPPTLNLIRSTSAFTTWTQNPLTNLGSSLLATHQALTGSYAFTAPSRSEYYIVFFAPFATSAVGTATVNATLRVPALAAAVASCPKGGITQCVLDLDGGQTMIFVAPPSGDS